MIVIRISSSLHSPCSPVKLTGCPEFLYIDHRVILCLMRYCPEH